MNRAGVILLVEDNPDDLDLTLRAFRKNNICNQIVIARDGQEALDYLFATSRGGDHTPAALPGVVLLDEAPLLEGGKQTRRGRLVQAEAACELGDSCFPLRFPQRNQKRRSAIDRPYRIPVEHFFS